MSRLVYCPSENCLEEAEKLAKELKLPILIGDSSQTVNLNFDRTKVQIINTNLLIAFETYTKAVVHKAHSVSCTFFEDFDIKNLSCIYTSEDGTVVEGTPVLVEKRYVKYIARLPLLGRWHVVLKNKQNVVGEEDINAISTKYS